MKCADFLLVLATIYACVAPQGASAQNYPTRPVRVVVPFGPGGGTDLVARLISKRLTEALGHAFTVDNRPGAGGNLGVELVTKSAPDGYTLLITTGSLSVSVSMNPKLPFNVHRDLAPISQLVSTPLVVTVHPSVPARSLGELVTLARRAPGSVNFGSSGIGTNTHLAMVMFNQLTGASLTHIPYKGAAAVITGVVTGEVAVGFPSVVSVQSYVKSGRLRALAVTTKRRSSLLPDLPTVDASYPGYDFDNWFGLFVPAGTPAPVVERLYDEVIKGLRHPESRDFARTEGGEAVGNSPSEFRASFSAEIAKYARIVKTSGISSEY